MKLDLFPPPEPFGWCDIAEKCRGGALPPGWLAAWGAHLRMSHATAAAEIEAVYAEAASDPEALARLKDARF